MDSTTGPSLLDTSSEAMSLDDLLDGIASDAGAALTGATPPSETDARQTSAVTDVPPLDAAPTPGTNVSAAPVDGAAPNAAPTTDDQSAASDAAPGTTQWDTPENPYLQTAQQFAQAFGALHQRAAQQKQAEQLAARDQILAAIPDMDPEQARWATAQLVNWERQQAAQQQQTLISQYEPYAKEVAIARMADKFSLTRDEIAELQQFEGDPRLMERYAEKISTQRKQYDDQNRRLKADMDALNARISAQERIASPADRVASGGGRAGVAPEDAESLDDLLAGLNLPVWR